MKPLEPDEPERDAWLREALRHAPDADAAASPALSETILKQARAATASAPAPRAASAWATAWTWLTRPAVAAGFASVMVATLVGLMWWDRPIDESLPRPNPAAARPPAVADRPLATASGDTEAPTTAPRSELPAQSTRAAAASPAPPPPPPAEREALRRTDPTPAARKQAVPGRPAPAPFQDDEPRIAAAAPPAQAPTRSPEAAPAAAAEPAPMQAAEPSARSAPSAAEDARAAAAPGRRESAPVGVAAADRTTSARDESSAPAVAPPSGSLSARALAKAAPPAAAIPTPPRQEDTADGHAPLAALLASVTEQPQRWTWQRGGAIQAMTPNLRRWLIQLDASALRWHSTGGPAAPGDDTAVRLYLDGALRSTLRLDDDGVWFTPAGASARASHAALGPTASAALKRLLDEAAP